MSKQLLAIIMALTLLFGTTLLASPVFANHCYDGTGGYPDSLHDSNGDCPSGTLDPGTVPAGNPTGDQEKITTLGDLLTRINAVLNAAVPFLVGLGVFVIIYGVFGYIRHSADEEKRTEAKLFIVWGLVGVFMMVSIWGFLNILVNTFSLKRTAPKVESVFPPGQ